jgi:integrase
VRSPINLRPINLRPLDAAFSFDLAKAASESQDRTKHGRYPQRDATLILVTYRHGLRATELCDLEWSQVDFDTATLHVRRAKNGKPATHPIRGDELRAALILHLAAVEAHSRCLQNIAVT